MDEWWLFFVWTQQKPLNRKRKWENWRDLPDGWSPGWYSCFLFLFVWQASDEIHPPHFERKADNSHKPPALWASLPLCFFRWWLTLPRPRFSTGWWPGCKCEHHRLGRRRGFRVQECFLLACQLWQIRISQKKTDSWAYFGITKKATVSFAELR